MPTDDEWPPPAPAGSPDGSRAENGAQHGDDPPQQEEEGVADAWMGRGARLRLLRELERQDDVERQNQLGKDPDEGGKGQPPPGSSPVLDYEEWLRGDQRYHDDYKHVDYRYIDFGCGGWGGSRGGDRAGAPDRRPLIVRQDKSLGKGGLCWDAAYVLGEYLAKLPVANARVVELGSGTGLCGLMAARARCDWHVTLTDLPRLLPLLESNVAANFGPIRLDGTDGTDPILREYLLRRFAGAPGLASDSSGRICARALEWTESPPSDDGEPSSFDVIAASDAVASIYDPAALACTIHRLSHPGSTACLSFKERLSSVHREFERKLAALFEDVKVLPPSAHVSRNRNEDVRILVARGKR